MKNLVSIEKIAEILDTSPKTIYDWRERLKYALIQLWKK